MTAEAIGAAFRAERVILAARDAAEGQAFEASLRAHGFGGAVTAWDAPMGASGRVVGAILWPRLEAEPVLLAMQAAGCRVVVLLGPAESRGEEVARARARLRRFARRLGLRLIGPSRLGVMSPAADLALSTWSPLPRSGAVGVLTHSDSIAAAVLAAMERDAVGLSHLVSLGESEDEEVADILDAFTMNAETRALLLQVQRIGMPCAALSALRAACRTKAVVALRTGAAFDPPPAGKTALSALALHDRVIDAALARAGAVRVDTLEAMADLAEILGHGKPLTPTDPTAPPRIAIVSNGAGPAAIAADIALGHGARLVAAGEEGALSTLDLGAEADAAAFADAVERLIAARAADVVAVLRWPTPGQDAQSFAHAIAAIAAKRSFYRPAQVVVGLIGGERDKAADAILREHMVPAFETPERVIRAALGDIAHAQRRAELLRLPARLAEDARRFVPSLVGWARAKLEGHSEPVLLEGTAAQPLLRVLELGLAREAVSDPGSTSLTFGLARDAVFGPVLVIAPATRIEADSPTAIALPPLDETLARLALAELRLGRVLLQREPEAARAVIARLVLLAEIASEVPAIAEVMLEGLRFTAGRLEVARVAVVLDPERAEAAPGTGMALPRYPRELESVVTLREGARVVLRPIRPEDARGLQRLFGKMTPEDRRMRLFVPVRELADALAARLSQIDYQREMCFVIEAPDEPGELAASARVVFEPDGEEAEYAISVRSDLKGLGYGRAVLTRALDYARERGIKRVWGAVLADNHGMLGLAEHLGMRRERAPDDPDVVRTVIDFA